MVQRPLEDGDVTPFLHFSLVGNPGLVNLVDPEILRVNPDLYMCRFPLHVCTGAVLGKARLEGANTPPFALALLSLTCTANAHNFTLYLLFPAPV